MTGVGVGLLDSKEKYEAAMREAAHSLAVEGMEVTPEDEAAAWRIFRGESTCEEEIRRIKEKAFKLAEEERRHA